MPRGTRPQGTQVEEATAMELVDMEDHGVDGREGVVSVDAKGTVLGSSPMAVRPRRQSRRMNSNPMPIGGSLPATLGASSHTVSRCAHSGELTSSHVQDGASPRAASSGGRHGTPLGTSPYGSGRSDATGHWCIEMVVGCDHSLKPAYTW